MTNVIYALHLDATKQHSLHNTWEGVSTKLLGVNFPVYQKFLIEDKEIAQHFSVHGVLPHNADVMTSHIFVSINETKYGIYPSWIPDVFVDKGHLPEHWKADNASEQRMSTSLYALYYILEHLSHVQMKHGPLPHPVMIHFDYFYPCKCVNEWIVFWKKNNWTKSDGSAVANCVLLKIIDAQLSKLHNISIHHVSNPVHQSGIDGFQTIKTSL
jgi:hypothetical protein